MHGADFGSILSSHICHLRPSDFVPGPAPHLIPPRPMVQCASHSGVRIMHRHVAMLEAVALARYISWVALSRCLLRRIVSAAVTSNSIDRCYFRLKQQQIGNSLLVACSLKGNLALPRVCTAPDLRNIKVGFAEGIFSWYQPLGMSSAPVKEVGWPKLPDGPRVAGIPMQVPSWKCLRSHEYSDVRLLGGCQPGSQKPRHPTNHFR